MQIGFICPDGVNIKHEECLAKCRLGRRCMTRPTLRRMSQVREWKNKPSVTQCLKGTMEAYLQVVAPYYVSPKSMVFMLDGTNLHESLEMFSGEGEISEVKVDTDLVGGTPDHLEIDENDPTGYVLYDYKRYGSYSVTKVLGGYITTEFVIGADGAPEVISRGPNKGQTKLIKRIKPPSPDQPMMIHPDSDVALQVNKYRRMLEEKGMKINRMECQITVRDGKTQVAIGRGVTEEAYMAQIPRLNDEEIDSLFEKKAKLLMFAVENNKCDEVCSQEERWDEDRKCKEYCNVWFACPYGRKVNEGIKQ